MNGEVCCIIGVCCPAGSEAQIDALAKEMEQDLGHAKGSGRRQAEWVLKHFDLAPKGTVAPLVAEIVRHARK